VFLTKSHQSRTRSSATTDKSFRRGQCGATSCRDRETGDAARFGCKHFGNSPRLSEPPGCQEQTPLDVCFTRDALGCLSRGLRADSHRSIPRGRYQQGEEGAQAEDAGGCISPSWQSSSSLATDSLYCWLRYNNKPWLVRHRFSSCAFRTAPTMYRMDHKGRAQRETVTVGDQQVGELVQHRFHPSWSCVATEACKVQLADS
jgi:hypothetical protein